MAVLNSRSNLNEHFRGRLMGSVQPTFSRCHYNLIFALIAICAICSAGVAQEATAGAQPKQVTPQNNVQAVQTPSQAASSSSNPQALSPESPKSSAIEEDSVGTSVIKLGPGDLIEVNVYNVPELATKARVSNSGDVYLPLIDYVHVEGLTQEEAQTLIQKRLDEGGFVRNPHVTIFVDEANSQGVTVIGEVGKPGIYPDPVDRKLYQVISEAGGFTQTASRKITILRRNQAAPLRVELPRNLGDDASGNIDILPGDTVTVPRAPIVYVVGDVGRPSGFLVDNGALTVLQALALAGGTNRTAKMGGARIIRKTPSGMTETPVQLKKMLEAKAPDVTLQADDSLFVPISSGKLAARRTADAAFAMATAVGIYSIHP